MKLIIGLGNPGFRYKKTRHNVGFMAADYIQKNIGGFSKWKNNKKLLAEISENLEQSIILAKPQTYMNKSGVAINSIIKNSKLEIKNLIVIHDDFDIPIGKFKIEKNRGAAGHKGVQSIIDLLGTNEFWRLRIGIRPGGESLGVELLMRSSTPNEAKNLVLKKFTREEKKIIEKIIPKAIRQLMNNEQQ